MFQMLHKLVILEPIIKSTQILIFDNDLWQSMQDDLTFDMKLLSRDRNFPSYKFYQYKTMQY